MRRAFVAALLAALLFGASASAQVGTGDRRLVTALKSQDITAARPLIRQRLGINTADVDGSTPLQWAAHWNDVETVKLLLAAGAKATVANRYGVTPLHEAATIGSAPVIAALLRAGAQASATYGEGETALMLAARAGSLESVKLLLEAGADVNASESFRGQTALMLAAVENHADVVKALIAAGAKPDTRSVEYKFQALTGGAGGIIHDRPQGGMNKVRSGDRSRSACRQMSPRPMTLESLVGSLNAEGQPA